MEHGVNISGRSWGDRQFDKVIAEKRINFDDEPEIAATVAAYVNPITPVEGATEAMAKISAELVDDQLILPGRRHTRGG